MYVQKQNIFRCYVREHETMKNMKENNITAMGKRIFIVASVLMVLAGLVGVLLEVHKMSQDTDLTLVKHDIVGDYDELYDEYFPRHYHATGLLTLPFDDIVEPFEAWFAGDRNMSRIDYYYGTYLQMIEKCSMNRWIVKPNNYNLKIKFVFSFLCLYFGYKFACFAGNLQYWCSLLVLVFY